ncbi:phage antirepressor KilAC domain-containing protein [Pseudomonas sp.]|uniref:phage antirepressor KilAC domain-containing protein n=1 Tax=Pseudomonas sp. TaxID=306 RepID=UPI0027304994|nr:phage antirepressor KilAC domain-containing protein [Pseudomonas sp.]MDP2447639.1 phage antirepressor KilAC domain-containing protein [Pseudomonas sp.]MDZ4334299.1 phage antirepressor KilAC domain-containing protein [Pseudomonas sp.]
MSNSFKYTAQRLGLGHRDLMKRMRTAGLLDNFNLPSNPEMTKHYLVTRENKFYSDEKGWRFTRTTRVTDAGIPWLARKLGIEQPMPEPQADPRDVA